jgi:hypothetical protein
MNANSLKAIPFHCKWFARLCANVLRYFCNNDTVKRPIAFFFSDNCCQRLPSRHAHSFEHQQPAIIEVESFENGLRFARFARVGG